MAAGLAAVLLGPLLVAQAAGGGTEAVPLDGLRAEVAALLVQGVPGGSLPIALLAAAPVAGDGADGAGVEFLVELPPAPAAEGLSERPLELYLYAVDAADEVVAHYAVGLEAWRASGEGLKVGGRLEAPPGELSVRALAWDPTARRYGLAVRRVGGGASPPRVDEPCAAWTAVGGGALAGLSARPVLVAGETRRLRPPAGGATGGPLAGGWRVRLAAVGAEVAAPDRSAVDLSVVAVDGGELELAVPELPPGVYELSLAPADGAPRSPGLEIWLVPELPPAAGGCRRTWPRVLRHARLGAAAETAPAPAHKEPPKAAPRRASRRLRSAYEAVLGRLADSGDLAAAAAELAALQTPVAAADATRARLLSAAEHAVARRLGQADGRCLVPLVALHTEAYRLHHRAGRFALATHNRRLAAAVAELAVELEAAPEERSLVAMALTGLADMVETRRASIEAQRLLERALELDGGLEAARLLLSVSYERKGRYHDARRQLDLLVSANSAHHEARVRLAILLSRIGEPALAERLLRALVAERPPGWLLSLAYQTLGRQMLREARLGEAVSTLREGAGRLPGDQALALLLAYALDRAGARDEVQAVLGALPLGEAGRSPRYRYSDEPAAALGLLRETLRQSVTVRLPLIRLALGDRPGADRAPGAAR